MCKAIEVEIGKSVRNVSFPFAFNNALFKSFLQILHNCTNKQTNKTNGCHFFDRAIWYKSNYPFLFPLPLLLILINLGSLSLSLHLPLWWVIFFKQTNMQLSPDRAWREATERQTACLYCRLMKGEQRPNFGTDSKTGYYPTYQRHPLSSSTLI